MITTDFAGKLVLVTGGAKNVGKAISRRFVERGAHVIVNFFHSLEASKQTAEELKALGGKVDVIRASVAQKDQVDRMFDEIEAKFGRLDILINNAAAGALLGLGEITEEHFDRAIDTNLKGAFWCARRAAALMTRSGGGSIVNVSSVGATLVPANYMVVGTSKAALESLTRYLAVEYAPRNIRVNTASTTLIDNEVATMFPESENTKRSSVAATPMKRLATANDMADLVLFLASDAARWITGQVVIADGGLSLCSEGLSPRPEATNAAVPISFNPAAETVAEAAPDLPENDEIAVVGMGLAVPGANDPEAFWKALMESPELFGNVPPDRWDYRSFYSPDASAEDKSYQSRSAFIDHFQALPRLQAEIDAGRAPRELTTLWLRHSLMQALEGVHLRDGDRTSFLVGYTADGSQHLEEAMVLAGARARLESVLDASNVSAEEREHCLGQIETILKSRYARGADGLAEFFPHQVGLEAMRGVLPDNAEYMMVDTACSSSLYSVDIGIKGLLLGQHDVVACGGAFALAPRGSVLFSKLHGLSKSGAVRPLDKACDGVLFSDGAGVVILKRLKRALADGDRVLAVLKAFGSSSDGKGKAIYAPNSAGQSIAIRRAYEHPAAEKTQIDWVVAHATGTPAGDLAEFQSLREMLSGDQPVQVTSNKSLVGHTGWAAGVVSLIQVVLGLQHRRIPAQHRFSSPPSAFEIESSSLTIPKQAVDWPAKPDSARVAAVSGFGFGGTNGHLVVAEHRPELPSRPGRPRQAEEPLVIAGWAAKFPGLASNDSVKDWLLGHGPAPQTSFGLSYPLPPFDRVRMPPAVLRALDRCQLMALDAAHDLREQLLEFWNAHAENIGIVMGHMGPTRNAALYASRCYLDDIETAVGGAGVADSGKLSEALAGLRKLTRSLVPATTENSFPGMMPNVIPARVANYYDLHGLNMTVDAGHASTLAAFEVAARYLRSGELDMVIVGGINGNVAEEVQPAFARPLAEGVVLFAVMTQAQAQAANLPVLARIDTGISAAQAPVSQLEARDIEGRLVTYAGADGALVALSTMLSGASRTEIALANDGDRARFALKVSGSATATTASLLPLPDAIRRTDVAADGEALGVKRYRIDLQEMPLNQGSAPLAFLPAKCVVVTDAPERLSAVDGLPADLVVLSSRPLAAERAGWHHVAEPNESSLAGLLPGGAAHVRVLMSLQAGALVPGRPAPAAPELLKVHDLAFLALKQCYDCLAEGGSFIALMLDGMSGDFMHPDAGLFSGLVKAMAIELPGLRSLAVVTDRTDLKQAIAQAQRESAAQHLLPVVALQGARRLTPRVTEDTGDLPADGMTRLGPDSVILAVGGARGITAELMKAVAGNFRPKMYLLGSSSYDKHPSEIFAGTDEEFARTKPQYIREQKALHPTAPLPSIIKSFDRLVEARAARRNLEAMQAACGADRVHYLRADMLDSASVQAAVEQILSREGHVDLLVYAAGLNRSASVKVKAFDDFVAVRDIKVRGYWNLRAAFAAQPPRMWCNFGSFIGLTGQAGETDYAAGNDFLNTHAAYHRSALSADEFTIGWTLWRSVGLGANPVTRAFLEKSGLFTSMRTEEGVHHFLREINLAQRAAATVHLGEAERRAIVGHLPAFFDAPAPATPALATPTGDFYIGHELQRDANSATFERVFDLEKDAYLQHHLVNGFATLPGTFVPELAAEAALQLWPGLKVVGFSDAVFHHFLRVYDAKRPSAKKIHAETVQREGDEIVVQVRITGDVLAPGGQVLVRDKRHFEIKVLLAPNYAPAPAWAPWPAAPHLPVDDPYHFAAAPVRLTEMFVSTTDTGCTPLGKRARYQLNVGAEDTVFSRFVVPSVLLDGLARVAVLNVVGGEYIPLAAPASIRRIDIYEDGNDCVLSRRHDRIDLYATPSEFALEGAKPSNRFVAARSDGRMVLQMKDVSGVIIGYVHRGTGAFVSKAEVDALLAGTPGKEVAA
jgi:NAD(P)-dependent dehydrogenase (short-subunit alcohol dehydrogenase family)/3-oxoacyl-(acyl-carrier-protein) synthase